MTGRWVSESEWRRWRRHSVGAWLALGLAVTFGFWLTARERSDRIDSAAVVIRSRCETSNANRRAIRQIVAFELREQEHADDRALILRVERGLPPVQDCRGQADAIRDLVD